MDSASLILFTHEFAPFRGGAATYVREIASALVAQGCPVEVWAADYRGRRELRTEHTSKEDISAFHVEHLPSNGRLTPAGVLGLMRGLLGLRKRLHGSRVVLLSVGALMAWMPLWALGLLPARGVVCFFHGSELLRFARQAGWRWLAKRFFARVNGFAVASRHVEGLARRSGLLPEEAEICLATCACPASLVAAAQTQAQADTAVAPANDGFWRILTVARLHPRKGQAELAGVLALLPGGLRERIIYQMAGTGTAEYRGQIEAACQAGGIRHEFLGGVSDEQLGPIYAGCTLYAQASRTLS